MSLTSPKIGPASRFGFNKARLKEICPDFADPEKASCYIPTRMEVFNLPFEKLKPMIVNWFTNAPAELQPSEEQKQSVLDLLGARRDKATIQGDLEELRKL